LRESAGFARLRRNANDVEDMMDSAGLSRWKQRAKEEVCMLRNIWIVLSVTLLSGSLALAQPPGPGNGNPGAYGIPGYPMPYGPAPMQPWAYPPGVGGMMPNMPNGNPLPMPIPPDPRRPVPLPIYDGAGSKQGATEPYMVGPEKSPLAAQPPAKAPAPALHPAPMMPDPFFAPACDGPPAPPAEPYTLYEGPRYMAEVKQDNVCVFGQVSYIHWWTRHEQTPPLLTTGNANLANPGSLANTDTTVLLGGGPIAPHEFSGVQAGFGMWLDPDRVNSVELGGFYLGKNSRQYNFASDANGNNVIVQPILSGNPPAENTLPIALPGLLAGSASVNSIMNMLGADINFGCNFIRYNGWTLDGLIGVRYMYLNDTLTSNQNFTVLPAATGAVSFLGVPQPAGTNFVLNDSFNVTNRFYGGQIGTRLDWVSCYKFDLGAVFKVAFGNTAHAVIIDGNTTVNGVTAPGGAYAQPSNIGHYSVNDFTTVTDLTLSVGYQIHPNIRLTAGYNLIYWPQVERAGEQIDRTLSAGQTPSGASFVPGTIAANPRFLNARSDFWAQGISVGVEVKY
jgi:Putative beta barrel porin-7 (BBP7)